MKITLDNVTAHELIGMEGKIIESKDPSLTNIYGKIVYETRNMLFINTNTKTRMIPKNAVKLSVKLPDGTQCIINGVDLVGRPEERMQRLI